jgi:hypothetical protein
VGLQLSGKNTLSSHADCHSTTNNKGKHDL